MPRTALRRYFRHGLLPQLMVFEAVARLGSVTKAADALHLAQPTVSIQLRKLAETLELPLFEQRSRRFELTSAGRELFSACQELTELLLRTETRLAGLRDGGTDSLRIAATAGARRLAARMLASFCGRHPGVQASLHVGNCAELMQRLAAQEDHLYIMTLPAVAAGVKAYPFAKQSLRFYCRPESALAQLPVVSLAQLACESFVVREPGSGTRDMLQALIEQASGELRIRAALGSDDAVAEAASGGLGMALLPTAMAAPFVADGFLVELRTNIPDLERTWQLVHAERATLPAVAVLFIREAQTERAMPAYAVTHEAPLPSRAWGEHYSTETTGIAACAAGGGLENR